MVFCFVWGFASRYNGAGVGLLGTEATVVIRAGAGGI